MSKNIENSSGYAWFICLISALFFFFIFIQTTAFNAINQYFQATFNATSTEVSFISSCYFIGCVVFIPLAGILVDRISAKNLILFWMLISTVATFLFATTNVLWVAGLMRIFIGLAGAFAFICSAKIAANWFKPERMAFVIGIIVTMAMAGGLVSQTPLTLLSRHYGWRDAMIYVGFLGVIITLLIWIFAKNNPKSYEEAIEKQRQELSSIGFWSSLGRVFSNSQNWFAGLYTSLLNLPTFLLGAIWGIAYLSQVHNFSEILSSGITAMIFIGMAIGSPLFGAVSDRMKKRRLPMIIGAVLCLITILLIMYTNASAWVYFVLFFCLGFTSGAQVIGYPAVAESNSSSVTGTALAIASTLIMAGGFTETLFGWMMHFEGPFKIVNGIHIYSAHSYSLPMLIMPIAMVVSVIMALLFKETHARSISKER